MTTRTKIALLGIIALAIFLRFWDLRSTPPGLFPDEAMNGNNVIEAMNNGHLEVFYKDNNGREALFINIQGLAVKLFGSKPWALRGVSGVFGVLTVLGLFLLAREMFYTKSYRDNLALLASFFLATSFWHINFSRIGFRAITAPFFLVWGLYFFFKFYRDIGSSKSQILSAAFGGLLFGLGFHSYIAYRASPVLLLLPIISGWNKSRRDTCFPCLCLIFILFFVIAFLPLGLYFISNPADFFGRTSQISIFSQASPIKALSINLAKTIGMFWFYGDPNWRHNFSGAPELSVIVGLFFFAGIVLGLRDILKRSSDKVERFNSFFLLFWISLMLAPVVISSEGLPHALRSIIAIPPVMILSAYGLIKILESITNWIGRNSEKYPAYSHQLRRIKREIYLLIAVMVLALTTNVTNKYFIEWANRSEVYDAFDTRDWNIGKFLNALPEHTKKYIVIKGERLDGRIVSISAQSLLFGTNTFLPEGRERKNFRFVSPQQLEFELKKDASPTDTIVVSLKEDDTTFDSMIIKKYPQIRVVVPGDFLVLLFPASQPKN